MIEAQILWQWIKQMFPIIMPVVFLLAVIVLTWFTASLQMAQRWRWRLKHTGDDMRNELIRRKEEKIKELEAQVEIYKTENETMRVNIRAGQAYANRTAEILAIPPVQKIVEKSLPARKVKVG